MITNQYTGEMYLSRRETEFMGLPVGNAFSGAPFKKKEMPFFIGPAVLAVGSAVGAAATALAVVNAVAVTAMVAGTAMTVVGAVTGDQDLMKWGAIVGLAGGVGSFAAGGIASLSAGASFSGGTSGILAGQAAAAQSVTAAGTGLATTAAGNIGAQISSTLPTAANVGNTANIATNAAAGTGVLSQGAVSAGTGALTPAFSSIAAPAAQTVTAPLAGSASAFGNLAGTGAAGTLANGAASVITPTATAAADTGFFGSMFGGMTGSDKALVLSGAASLLKGFGNDDDDTKIEVAKIGAEANLKSAQMQQETAERRLQAEKDISAQKFANMDYQPTMTWEVGDKSTGMIKQMGSGSKLASKANSPTATTVGGK
jgi:hypothetical protein